MLCWNWGASCLRSSLSVEVDISITRHCNWCAQTPTCARDDPNTLLGSLVVREISQSSNNENSKGEVVVVHIGGISLIMRDDQRWPVQSSPRQPSYILKSTATTVMWPVYMIAILELRSQITLSSPSLGPHSACDGTVALALASLVASATERAQTRPEKTRCEWLPRLLG
jgi:hypothetical protein